MARSRAKLTGVSRGFSKTSRRYLTTGAAIAEEANTS